MSPLILEAISSKLTVSRATESARDDTAMFVQENIEKLKKEWTDKYVVAKAGSGFGTTCR